jgi:hypothetical protein
MELVVPKPIEIICTPEICPEMDFACEYVKPLYVYYNNDDELVYKGTKTLFRVFYYGFGALTVLMSLLYLRFRIWPLKHK